MKAFPILLILILCLFSASKPLQAQVRISEFMASNTHTLADDAGEYSDWIEIQNTTATNVNLQNWALSDSAGTPAKWLFPATNLAPHGFMIVFATGKDIRIPGKTLHVNFKLSADGEYLALTRPNGTIASVIQPGYPQQFPDVSYGFAMASSGTVLIATNAPIHYQIPIDNSADNVWMQPTFSDANWITGLNGLGYETGLNDPQESSYSQTCLSTAPIAYWRLNETNGPAAINVGTTGVDNQAGYMGNVTLGMSGPRSPKNGAFETNNLAPYFNGTDAYVNGPYQLLDNVTEFTMAGWINPAGPQPGRTGLFGQNDLIEFGFSSTGVLDVWTPYGDVSFSYPYPANEWHHVAVAGGNGSLKLYVDGILAGTTSVDTQTFGTSEYYFNIGGGGIWDSSGNYFNGQIDEVAVWYRALSQDEIKRLVSNTSSTVNFTPYINTDVQKTLYGKNSTVYVRIPFQTTDPESFDALKLLVRYDDGFAVWLNGQPVAQVNSPQTLNWQSTATDRHIDSDAIQWAEFDISTAIGYLKNGDNVLAIQALNIAATNTDFLIQAQLLAQTVSQEATWRYFTLPTPATVNGTSVLDQGPIISNAGHFPAQVTTTNPLIVTTTATQAFAPISNVTLHYRVMFGSEVTLSMNDSGLDGDVKAGDGIWTATIPAGVAPAGNMLRYYVTATDTLSSNSRWPIFPSATTSQQYYGTVITDSSIHSLLPVACLFIQNPSSADTRTGTQASLYYLNELYDNITIRLHGQSSAGWPKHSYNIDLPKDHELLYKTNGMRLKNIRLLSNYGDKMRMHTTLTYEIVKMAGGYGHFSFPIRVQRNGSFYSIVDMVEDGDDYFLDRVGLDPNGALYKMYNEASSASGNEKKTREWEGTDDLTAFLNNIASYLPLATRSAYAWDHIDLPQAANYFATLAIASSQDHGHKNFYLYHDNDGTGEWSILPWDVDLTWGRNWLDSQGYFTDTLYTNNVLNFYNPSQQGKPSNRFYDLIFSQSEFRQMYLRRLRTLMDTLLMAPKTPESQLVIEPLIRHYEDIMSPTNMSPSDATLDMSLWGPNWGNSSYQNLRTEAERTISTYLVGRRSFLFNNTAATLNGDRIPTTQPVDALIYIASWDCNPVSGNPAEQYIELRNTNTFAVDVSDWQITGAVAMKLHPGTVIPSGRSLYLTPSVNAFRSRKTGPRAGQSLFVQGAYSGYLSPNGNSPLTLRRPDGSTAYANSYASGTGQTQLFPTNLVVLRLGDGQENLSSRGNSIFLDQYATNGTFCGTISISNNGPNAFLISGTASSEGALSLSSDGRLLVLAGYNLPLTNSVSLNASLANSTAIEVPRAIAAVDLLGNTAIVGITTNQFNKNNIRCATSDGYGHYWAAGANSGVVSFSDNNPQLIETNIVNCVTLRSVENHLVLGTTKSIPGLYLIPQTSIDMQTPMIQLATGVGSSPFSFAFSPDGNTAYIADDSLAGRGGVQRWDLTNGTWTLSYVFAGLTNSGARGLAVDFSKAKPVLFATTAEAATNRLVSIVDTGVDAKITTLATSGINQIFRGVVFGPESQIAPRLCGTQNTADGMTLKWTTLAGQNYVVEYTDDIGSANWQTLQQFTASKPESITHIATNNEGNRFFRLRLARYGFSVGLN